MIDWLKDIFGINKWVVCYSVPYPEMDWTLEGRSSMPCSRAVAKAVAHKMNNHYVKRGINTHWIERA